MPIEYIQYDAETAEGQAVLDDFPRSHRVLKYRDNGKVFDDINRGMPLYDLDLTETVGKPDSGNMVIRGEALTACAYLKKRIDAGKQRSIDLVYIDPPFASGADYAKKIVLRHNPKRAEAEKEVQEAASNGDITTDEFRSFEEKMYGDIWNKERYLNWMYTNLRAIKSVMSPTASIYVHLDWHIGHYVKILMDEIFGEDNFRNEITWQRANAHSDAKQGAEHFGRMHDVIFYYALAENSVFHTQYVPYEQEFIDRYYNRVEPGTGRRYWLDNLQAPGGAAKGNPYYEVMGVSRYWRYSRERMQELIKEGRIVQTRPGTVPKYKRYLDEMPGRPVQDMWTDVKSLSGLGSKVGERFDYATQKPEALLERIIKASSDEGMLVADFFGGSGTTAAVAAKTGRNFIHVDVGVNSVETVHDRLTAINPCPSFDMLRVQDGVSLFRNPVQTMDKLKTLIPRLTNADELNSPWWNGSFRTAREGLVPVHIPDLKDSDAKLLDETTILRIIHEGLPDLVGLGTVRKVVVYYVDVDDKQAIQAFADAQNDTPIDIELRDLKPLLAETVLEDEFHVTVSGNDYGDALMPVKVTFDSFSSDRLESSIEEFNLRNHLSLRAPVQDIVISESGLELIELVSLDCTHDTGPWHADVEIRMPATGGVYEGANRIADEWDGTIVAPSTPKRIKVRNIAGDETVVSLAQAVEGNA